MTKEWSIGNDILAATHRWPIILIFCLVGAALGWAVSLIWPSPYQASAELYVGLNTYRALEDRNVVEYANGEPFNTPDDYKNWQMANLNAVVLMDGLIKETLDQLRQQDSYWQSIQKDELREMLRVYWRNTGRWRLVAENQNPHSAEQAALAWREIILIQLDKAVSNAQQTLNTDIQMQNLATEQAALSSRLAQLQNAQEQVNARRRSVSDRQADQPITVAAHWELWSAIGEVAQSNAVWQSLIAAYPAEPSLPADYLSWLDRADILLESAVTSVQTQIESLNKEQEVLGEQYALAAKRSLGFSAALEVEKISNTPEMTVSRPTGQLILTGSALGLIFWMLIWSIRLALRNN